MAVNAGASIANALWLAANLPPWAAFRSALKNPRQAQQRRLQRYLQDNADTEFGKKHRFRSITNYKEYAARVPLHRYEELSPWIDRIRRGEANLLTRDTVTHLAPTSGTAAGRKLIPFTSTLQREFGAAIAPWLTDLYGRFPALGFGRAYWSVTPAFQSGPVEESAVPIGFEQDSDYLGGAKRALVRAVMAASPALGQARTLDAFRYATLLTLLRCRDLRLISVWHPSFLSLLINTMPARWAELLCDIASGHCAFGDAYPENVHHQLRARPMPERAAELQSLGPENLTKLWPNLRLVSCWGDGAAAGPFARLKLCFPKATFQPKGLIATEAFVSLPFGDAQPLAICSHFFEFADDSGRVFLVDGLQAGEEYEVIVTTGSGFYRYCLGDRVRVTGFVEKTPCIEFLTRTGHVVDLCGEKLSESFVLQALQKAWPSKSHMPPFALLAPDSPPSGVPSYTLFIEHTAVPTEIAIVLDAALRRNPHYAYCRDLQQLGPIRIYAIAGDAYSVFAERVAGKGARLGDIKPAALSRLSGWSSYFTGRYLA